MSNDNDPRDDAMRGIEAALEHYGMACIDEIGDGTPECYERTNAVKGKLLAMIRSKLPQPDAEHERAVEAWQESFRELTVCVGGYECSHDQYSRWRAVLDEALRLMRARQATCKDGLQVEAAGKLLRAAKEAWPWVYGHPKQSDELWQAIAKAERAGIKP